MRISTQRNHFFFPIVSCHFIYFLYVCYTKVDILQITMLKGSFYLWTIFPLSPSFRIMKSIDAVLHLSKIFGLPASEPGILVVEFIFSVLWQLLEASLDDEGLLNHSLEQKSRWLTKSPEMEIDSHGSYDEKWNEHSEILQNANTVMAIEIIGKLLQHKGTSRILYLARRHLYVHPSSSSAS